MAPGGAGGVQRTCTGMSSGDSTEADQGEQGARGRSQIMGGGTTGFAAEWTRMETVVSFSVTWGHWRAWRGSGILTK